MTCDTCGAPMAAQARFCAKCGTEKSGGNNRPPSMRVWIVVTAVVILAVIGTGAML